MKKSTKVVYLEKSQSAQGAVVKAGEYTEVVGTCRGILFQTLNEAIRELFVEIDDDLYKLAENSTSNARQTLFFDAMRSIRILQKQAEPAYLQMIEDAYQSFWNGDTILSARQAESQEEENLSLVEKDDLEEDLAVSTMINKTNDACHRELAALNARFAHMLGKGDLTVEANPVSPAMLALAFREILQEWDSEVLARIVVYKCFDRVVLSRMKACYEAMNHYLVEKGILPEIRHGVPVSSRPAAERATHTSPAGGVQEPGGAAGEPEQEVPSLTQIWQFLQQHGVLPETGLLRVDVNPGLPVMPRTGVMEALTRLQGDVHSDHELEQLDP
ncbi:MAG TPA: DUF1631 family protein, partial [Chromatiaceae bacterium]|nr:DUF1631 family protein [Chromatiaceae bacterium]